MENPEQIDLFGAEQVIVDLNRSIQEIKNEIREICIKQKKAVNFDDLIAREKSLKDRESLIGWFDSVKNKRIDVSQDLNAEGKIMSVKVEGRNKAIYSVDLLKRTCSCGHEKCSHLRKANDFILEKGKFFKYSTVSAFHKEIRRGDVKRAINFGYWVKEMSGEYYLKNYVKNIVTEETRSDVLAKKFKNNTDLSWEEMVSDLCVTKKWYDIPSRAAIECDEIRARWNAKKMERSNDDIRIGLDAVLKSGIPYEIFLFHFSISNDDESRDVYRKAIYEKMKEKGIGDIASSYWGYADDTIAMIDVLQGFIGEERNSAVEKVESDMKIYKDFIPVIPVYAEDAHTMLGKNRMLKSVGNILAKEKLPEDIDLRWSGTAIGIVFRCLKTLQGKNVHCNWEEVEWPDDIWQIITQWESEVITRSNSEIREKWVSNAHEDKYGQKNLFPAF